MDLSGQGHDKEYFATLYTGTCTKNSYVLSNSTVHTHSLSLDISVQTLRICMPPIQYDTHLSEPTEPSDSEVLEVVDTLSVAFWLAWLPFSVDLSPDCCCDSIFRLSDFRLCDGDHSRAVACGRFLLVSLSIVSDCRSHSSRGLSLNPSIKYCLEKIYIIIQYKELPEQDNYTQ